MRANLPNIALFVMLVAAAYGIQQWFFPAPPAPPAPPPPPPAIAQESLAALAGGGSVAAEPFSRMAHLPKPVEAPKPAVKDIKPVSPSEPRKLIALGNDDFYLKVLLTDKGAGVQQVVLTKFPDANRLGREIQNADGTSRALPLIPGYQRPWKPELQYEPPPVDLVPTYGPAEFAAKTPARPLPVEEGVLTRPSYALYHYPSRDDPARPRNEEGALRNEDDNYPLATLGERAWTITEISQPADGPWSVTFETELPAPYHLRLRKIYVLAAKDYDFKLKVDVIPLPGRAKGVGAFRYQIAGPLGMPVEGEWYTSSYRTAYVGWADADGKERRAVEDPSSIHYKHGSEPLGRQNRYRFAAVGTQYFASALAVDGETTAQNQPWEYVRATREQNQESRLEGVEYDYDKAYLYDVTIRAVSVPLDPGPTESIRHTYSVYNGPMKVRLLKQMTGDLAVADDTVNRYLNEYHLDSLTDLHSPNFFGRFSNSIYWADLLIGATNIMHSLLGFLQSLVGSWGVSIMLLTVVVKLSLLYFSRRQQAINAKMQAQIATIKPQLDELSAKHKDDFMVLSQEKQKLMRKAGIRHSAQLGGCLLLFAQMPILMGLYYSLQESIFFRLEPFLWMPNLAAPDMLSWWSEQIPFISTPDARFGSFSFLYLGPYFNLLPLFAVVLFYVQQKLTMPPPTDEQQEMQQKMMKYMLVFSALFFYKVASGLCVYFIVSGLWSLIERQLVPKPKIDEAKIKAALAGELAEPEKPKGWLGKKLAEARVKMEDLQKQAENQRQIRNTPQAPSANDALSRNERRAGKKKKK